MLQSSRVDEGLKMSFSFFFVLCHNQVICSCVLYYESHCHCLNIAYINLVIQVICWV